jgi:hypothetical protein
MAAVPVLRWQMFAAPAVRALDLVVAAAWAMADRLDRRQASRFPARAVTVSVTEKRGLGTGGGGRSVLAKGLIGNDPFGTDVLPVDRPGAGTARYGGGKGSGVTVAGLRNGLGHGYGPGNGRGTGVRNTGRGNGMGSERPGPGAGWGDSGTGTGGGRSGRVRVASIGGGGFNPLGGLGGGDERAGTGEGVGPGGGANRGNALASLRNVPGNGGLNGSGDGNSPRGNAPRGNGLGGEKPGPGGAGNGEGSGIGRAAVAAVTNSRRAIPRTADLSEDVGEKFKFNGLPPRGAPFKEAKNADFDGPLNIVYCLDLSGSMNQKMKFSRAKRSLRNAVLELQPQDTFNIVTFNANIGEFSSDMVKATEANVEKALKFIDDLHTEDGTDFGAGLGKALAMNNVSHIFLLTDGEPNRGITDDKELRQFVKAKNTQRAQILSVALGQFKGWDLLKALAEENGGIFQSIRLN